MPKKVKGHSNLGLSFAEFGALLGTRAMLVSDALVDAKGKSAPKDDKTHSFNMAVPCRVHGCGSVGCIGGTMGQIMGMNADQAENYVYDKQNDGGPLRALFFPPQQYEFEKITKAHAVKAIDNFLATGKPRWETFLPKSILTTDYED